MNNFDLKKFLVENKLTSNSSMKEERGPVIDVNTDEEVESWEGKQVLTFYVFDTEFYKWLSANYTLNFEDGDEDEGFSGDIDITYEEFLEIMNYDDNVEFDRDQIGYD